MLHFISLAKPCNGLIINRVIAFDLICMDVTCAYPHAGGQGPIIASEATPIFLSLFNTTEAATIMDCNRQGIDFLQLVSSSIQTSSDKDSSDKEKNCGKYWQIFCHCLNFHCWRLEEKTHWGYRIVCVCTTSMLGQVLSETLQNCSSHHHWWNDFFCLQMLQMVLWKD